MAAHNKNILEEANALITKGDYEGFLSYCTEDTRWTFVGDQTLEGKDAVRQYMAATYLEPPQFKVEHLIADADFVTAVGTISLRSDQGKSTAYDYCDVWRIKNGKLAEVKAFVIESK
jgi:ketosteroid isomerase-like protein